LQSIVSRSSTKHPSYLEHRGDAVQHALDVDIDHSLPLFNLKRGKRRQEHQSSIVDQNIGASEPIDRRLDDLIHLLALRRIDLAVVCRTALSPISAAIRFKLSSLRARGTPSHPSQPKGTL
jgi:hypothetical protein